MSTLATDKFYYIMDYSGHYYRTDARNQLVVASDEAEAAVFSFIDANKRISGGNRSKFYFMTPVSKDDKVDLGDEMSVDSLNSSISGVIISAARELTEAEIPEEIEKSTSEYDLSKMDWKEYLTHFTFIAAGLKEYREDLIKAQSDVDQKICDVLHYIELCDTSDEEAADLVELLKVCRENRRSIKDEVIRVDSFQRNLGTSANVAKAKEALKAIKGLETRKYTPRKFTELFAGSTMKATATRDRKISGGRLEEVPHREEETYTEEEINMEYVRRETPFDGKENDWMAFAMQQAEFYRNAEQYIVNLQLDIDEIDAAITELMAEIETSNCNVTQGYKLFKRMKELRLERKKKEKELETLYILTEHFDVSAMADECADNANALEQYLYGSDADKQTAHMEDDENNVAGNEQPMTWRAV